jgi:hydroxyacylglutathione hydrolase
MKTNKFLIIFFMIIFITVLSFFSITGCKLTGEIKKEEISSEEKSEQELDTEAEEDAVIIEETEEISEIISISPAEVYDIITNDEDYIILDVRTQDEYNEGHLDKALLIPVDELEGRIDELDKNNPIITYCRSGARSNRAANILIENGFSKVYDMGGILGWEEEGFPVEVEEGAVSAIEFLTVDEAYEIFLNNEDYLFIDVRSEDEYKSGHIQGAIHIPVSEIESRLDEIPIDKPAIVYCNGSSCNRSGQAASILKENGYKEVFDLIGGGVFEWEEKGYPIVKEE